MKMGFQAAITHKGLLKKKFLENLRLISKSGEGI